MLVRGSYAPAHRSGGQSHLIDCFENGDNPLPPVLVEAEFVLGRASSAFLEEIYHVLKRMQRLVTNESAHELLHQVVDTVLRLQSREIACAAIFQPYERASVHRNGPTVTVHHQKCREKRQGSLTSPGVPPGYHLILLHRIISHRSGKPCVFVRGPRTRYALSAAAFSSSFSLYTESPITPPLSIR